MSRRYSNSCHTRESISGVISAITFTIRWRKSSKSATGVWYTRFLTNLKKSLVTSSQATLAALDDLLTLLHEEVAVYSNVDVIVYERRPGRWIRHIQLPWCLPSDLLGLRTKQACNLSTWAVVMRRFPTFTNKTVSLSCLSQCRVLSLVGWFIARSVRKRRCTHVTDCILANHKTHWTLFCTFHILRCVQIARKTKFYKNSLQWNELQTRLTATMHIFLFIVI